MKYVIGDIHCQIDTLTRLIRKLNLQEDDEVFFVGDWVDRYFRPGDMIDTMQWVVDNIDLKGKFKSVIGNHDKAMVDEISRYIFYCGGDEKKGIELYVRESFLTAIYSYEMNFTDLCNLFLKFYHIIKGLPLYIGICIRDKETGVWKNIYVTHSWIVDRDGLSVWDKEFNCDYIDDHASMWDRYYSMIGEVWKDATASIIHGHTPTLGRNHHYETGIRPLAKIMNRNEMNINIDCCAFRGPMLGGNLAAYRCDDGAEFYAYEDSDFYTLLDMWLETPEAQYLSFDKDAYIISISCYKRLLSAFGDCPFVENITFDCDRTRDAYIAMRDRLSVDGRFSCNNVREFEFNHSRFVDCFTDVWKDLREKFNEGIFRYNKSFVSIFDRPLEDFSGFLNHDAEQ